MLVSGVLIKFVPLLQSVLALTTDRVFRNSLSKANTVYHNYLLFESPARSRLNCLVMCSLAKCCVRFTYTTMTGAPGLCRGHSPQWFHPEDGEDVPGTTMFIWTGLRENAGEVRNEALNKVATQSSGVYPYTAVDGSYNTVYYPDHACTHTQTTPGQANWWQVDLGGDTCGFDIFSVIITNRGDCCADRLRDFDVHVYNEDPAMDASAVGVFCSHYTGAMGAAVTEEMHCWNGPIRGRFLRVTNTPEIALTLCEVQVMAVPAL